MEENWCITWDTYHKNICIGLEALQQNGEFVDMTLAADGHYVKVHQMMMSLASPYIKKLISTANCPHPIIFLNRVSLETLQAILQFAYTGEVVIEKDKIEEFLDACKDLHIRGLDNMSSKNEKEAKETQSTLSDHGNNDYAPNGRKRKKHSPEVIYEDEIMEHTENDETQQCDDDETDVNDDEKAANIHDEKNDEMNDAVKAEVKKRMKTESDPLLLGNYRIKAPMELTSPLKYSVSQHGNMQIVLNRYLYSFIHVRKNKQWYWRCVNQQKTGCVAHVTTDGDKVLARGSYHNHAYHDAQIQKRIKNDNMFTDIKQVQDIVSKKKRKRADLVKQALNTVC